MKPLPRALILAGLIFVGLGLASVILDLARHSSGQSSIAEQSSGLLQSEPAQAAPLAGSSIRVVRAYFDDPDMVKLAAAFLEPWEVNYTAGFLVAEVDQYTKERLQELGFRLEVDKKLTQQLSQSLTVLPLQTSGIPSYPCYRTVEETYAAAEAIADTYPDLATWLDIGDSWEKTSPDGLPGYDLKVLRLTNSQLPGPKPKLFIMAAIHAREYTTAELATRFAEYLVSHYDLDADVTWLLDSVEIHLLLQSNPDGRALAEDGLYWRKNTNNNYCSDTEYRGADLNRNFSFEWGCCNGSSTDPCNLIYRGPLPASEPETLAVEAYLRAEYPDLRPNDLDTPAPADAQGIFIDLHSYSELVLWPWGFVEIPPPNATALQTLGRKLAFFNNYVPSQAIELYPTDGTTDDYAYGDLGIASYSFELGTAFFESCTDFEAKILPANLPALLYSAKVTRAPYLLPSGPDVSDLQLETVALTPGTPVQVNAKVDDGRYSTRNGSEPVQDIAGAYYTLDALPWLTTSTAAQPLQAVDGAFDTSSEWVSATLDTSSLAFGRHTLYLYGQDASGNWGPVSAANFYLLDPASAPVLQGSVKEILTGLPLAATVIANEYHADSDPTSGDYAMLLMSGTYTVSASAPGYAISQTAAVPILDGQVTQLDFELYPICTLFEDDVESGINGWEAEPPWAITALESHSPSHSWTDSPFDNYLDKEDLYLTSPLVNLVGTQEVRLKFWQKIDIEPIYDYGAVDYSSDGGATWHRAATYAGYAQPWEEISLDLPDLAGSPQAQLRFHFHSDESITADGWYLDDIRLEASGPVCLPHRPPVAAFTTNSPVELGQAMEFTNLTTGTPPISYTWDFGDGSAVSTATHPSHTYLLTGTYTVTLEAASAFGSDQEQASVIVGETVHIAGLGLSLAGSLPYYIGQTQTAILSIEPLTVTIPYSFSLDFGDGSPLLLGQASANPLTIEHTYNIRGSYTLTALAWNLGMSAPVSATLEVYLADPRGAILRLPFVPDLFIPSGLAPPGSSPPPAG